MTAPKDNRSADGTSIVEWRVQRSSADTFNEASDALPIREVTIYYTHCRYTL